MLKPCSPQPRPLQPLRSPIASTSPASWTALSSIRPPASRPARQLRPAHPRLRWTAPMPAPMPRNRRRRIPGPSTSARWAATARRPTPPDRRNWSSRARPGRSRPPPARPRARARSSPGPVLQRPFHHIWSVPPASGGRPMRPMPPRHPAPRTAGDSRPCPSATAPSVTATAAAYPSRKSAGQNGPAKVHEAEVHGYVP